MTTTHAAIAADSPFTLEAGCRIAREGGNAVDIALASALTATVSEILMCSLGGSAFLMIRMPGQKPELTDGADAVPSVPDSTSDRAISWRAAHLPYGDGIEVMAGHASVGVPGMLAAVELAWRRHGSLPWREIVAPALELAQTEFPAGATLGRWLALAGDILFYPQQASRECFFRKDGQPVREGEPFSVPHLSESLEAISREGAQTLYQGDLAAAFAKEMEEHGGCVTREDLAAYRAQVREPLTIHSGGFQLALNPPPAVGGAAVGILVKLIESAWKPDMSPSERALLHAHAQGYLLGVRKNELATLDFDSQIVHELLHQTRLNEHRHALNSPNTTHLSVVTGDGAMVGVTMSNGYGSGITIPGTGIACNNSLGEPELNPRGYHVAERGSRLVSNMAPTVAWQADGRCAAFGSPGASRITTSIAQTWVRYALEGATLEEAVAAPRLHIESLRDGLRLQCEPGIDTSLAQSQYAIRPFEQPDMYFGAVKLAGLDGQGRLHAVADNRRHGATEIVQ